uniref:Uncharacterized protein LOC114349304 n=1 Tax=Diabrotica virgifera virgifera TaxID=50390 RepID=A0A6P7HIJ0_DIAVI
MKYIDYMSDQEDFSTFYGDNEDSYDWLPVQSASDEETNDAESTGKTRKKKKNFRRIKPTTNGSGIEEETIGDAGFTERKNNERKERSKKKRAGEEYTIKKGVTVPAKKFLPNPCQGKKCGKNCGSIPEERRE